MELHIIVIILSLILSAFFSGMEIAYVSSNKIHIEIEKKQGGFISNILARLTKKPSKFIATMLVGNNIALVIYGFYMGEILMKIIAGYFPEIAGSITLLLQTCISTLVILITAEFLPKVFFQIYSNTLLKAFSFPAYVFYVVFTPISSFVIWVSDFVLKKFLKTDGDQVQLAFSKTELGDYINEQMETIEEHDEIDSEIQIFQNALDFSDVKSREVMVPRTEIVGVAKLQSIEEVSTLFIDTGLSKIIVYNNTVDDIIGYVHSFELFKKPKSLRSILLPVVFVPETMFVKDVLNLLTKKHKSIAVVIDEYGGTSGIITVEDIVEELFGEIEDEHDSVELIEEQLSENDYRFSARIEVDHINESYKLDLPEDENYETLGGMIVNHTEEIPQQGEEVKIDGFKIKIIETSNTKIEIVELHVIPED
ncbi:CBS domain containing-hemolysin-like protein [Aquimarina sp. EL_43]|uniref:hemolysin family protein n=1 Tax=unclassified Aquimarina TaxID=2627091 RepID=UPI0018CB67B9|nr:MULTISPECIES: hemolysin family protein [unclassified Aquimarina]MBG6130411.1 CBS domain containing-hemolysin-like protein [Aquimarina sp. EL_35]MBG6149191.1 CBS domain containing-hemolysin-like protein [Aquimarina sp. EL_32]MBG6168435.1 CBS domain containing-hemolysin-like protein [Aquimarina sp. EL_43]